MIVKWRSSKLYHSVNKLCNPTLFSQCQSIVQNLTKKFMQLESENQVLQESKSALEAEVYRHKVTNAELREKNANLERENKNLLGMYFVRHSYFTSREVYVS